MGVRVRSYHRGGWHVDVRLKLPDGTRFRERKVITASKSVAQRWGQERERHLLVNGLPKATKEVPTLEEFAPRFLDGHARANRQKPSGIVAKESILNQHLIPMLGKTRLDAITSEAVQQLKRGLQTKAAKTTNNVLTVLGVLLKKAVEWNVIDRMPCVIRLLAVPSASMAFHDVEEYEKLVQAAARIDQNSYLLVLLGGDAGLRLGEMMALEWSDVDLHKRQLTVQHSDWKGHVTATKGGRLRHVPMTERLAAALKAFRHLRGRRVLVQSSGEPLTMKIVQDRVASAARRAGVRSGVHILRHTFCSHLAMGSAPARAIQELAGHQDLKTTQRYMHLSPAAIEGAIRLLDASRTGVTGNSHGAVKSTIGNMLATGSTE
jgi:integrase